MQLELRIGLPAATQPMNVSRSGMLSASGLSMKTGTPASTKGRARSTCSEPRSVATSTASTCPIISSGLSTTLGLRAQAATCSAVKPPSTVQQMCVTFAPGMPNADSGSLFKYAGMPAKWHSRVIRSRS